MLQKLKQTSEADEKPSESPVSSESLGVNDAVDADEVDDGGRVQDEHESHSNMAKSSSEDEDNNDGDGGADGDDVASINGKSPVSCQHDSEANPDNMQSQYSKETITNDQPASAEIDHSTIAKSDSGCNSPCTASAAADDDDDDDTKTTSGNNNKKLSYCRDTTRHSCVM